jgi:hypothetical protein
MEIKEPKLAGKNEKDETCNCKTVERLGSTCIWTMYISPYNAVEIADGVPTSLEVTNDMFDTFSDPRVDQSKYTWGWQTI